MTSSDFIVIGGGIAGISAAAELAREGSVVLLEREERLAYHTTGRSAAFFTINYGNDVIRGLTAASGPFLTDPPDGFAEAPLMSPHPAVTIARADQDAAFAANLAEATASPGSIVEISPAEAEAMIGVMAPGYLARAHLEPDAQAMDVDLIHGGFRRQLAARGGEVVCNAEVLGLERTAGLWHVATAAGTFQAPIVVNAAGAWADVVAGLAGARPVGLRPKRRTVILFDPPADTDMGACPLVIDCEELFYFKPDAGMVLASPADETDSPPCDAQPEELDIARVIDSIERATTLRVRRVAHKWAGLRSFVRDRTPVVGLDPENEGFLWLAGQGGYGIMTSPAMSRAAAALATGNAWPADIAAFGIQPEDLSPARFNR
ncbi:MAG: FAD-binding oxidoreductase [Alphaproteobacteria bacterium]|jgi:D-arginine dehydrogenase|nr:FAD-binding oxidoreductase [Alphaproteobacteria bacterium]